MHARPCPRYRIPYALVALAGLFPPAAHAGVPPGLAGGFNALTPEAINARVGTMITSLQAHDAFVGASLGVIDQNGYAFYNYGRRSEADPTAPNEHSAYEIGSLSKTFLGVLAANTYGSAGLNTPFAPQMPPGINLQQRADGVDITLRNIVTHRSGYGEFPAFNVVPDSMAVINSMISGVASYNASTFSSIVNTAPRPDLEGQTFKYSNVAAGILTYALETKNGASFDQQVKTVIAAPLGMTETAVSYTPEMAANRTAGYTLDPGSRNAVNDMDFSATVVAGAGGLRSTANDLLIYIGANVGLTSADPQLRAALDLAMQPLDDPLGMFWVVSPDGDKVYFEGMTVGHEAWVVFSRSQKRGVVLLLNTASGRFDWFMEATQSCVMDLYAAMIPEPATNATITAAAALAATALYRGRRPKR